MFTASETRDLQGFAGICRALQGFANLVLENVEALLFGTISIDLNCNYPDSFIPGKHVLRVLSEQGGGVCSRDLVAAFFHSTK